MTAAAARWVALAAALVGGLLQAGSIAWPWGGEPLWWLQVFSLALLAALLLRQEGGGRAALLGGLFATAWLAGTFWWLFISMHVYGGLAALLAAIAVLALAAVLSLYYAVAAGLFRVLARGSPLHDSVLFAALWTGAELLRGTWFTGFPWGAGGYAHVDGPLATWAHVVGVYGIGGMAALVAMLLATALPKVARVPVLRPTVAMLAGVAVVTLVLGRIAAPEPARAQGGFTVALLQGNIPQDEKFEGGTGIPVALDWYGQALARTRASLVVAPETAIPLLPQQLPEGYLDGLQRAFASGDRAALVGMPLGSFAEGYTNSVLGFKPGDAAYRYHKDHLVPFGEFIPPLFKWFTRMMNIPLGDFNRGGTGQASFEWQGQRLAPNVCYEDLFGEELGLRFRDEAKAPTVFVNLSNIAWFGDTVAIDQHLHISRMRALEFRRPMIRATNTGATAVIDHTGRVALMLPRHTRGVLTGTVEGRTGVTPYAWWVARAGLWPLWLLALGVPALAWLARRRRGGPYK